MRRWMRCWVATAVLLGIASPSLGQEDQYTAPEDQGADPGDEQEELERAADESMWTLGRIRIDPWIGLREIAWIEPPDQDGDLTASAGAGVRIYAPIGSHMTAAAQIAPVYIWWRDRDEDRRIGGNYGAGLFYFRDRLRVRLSATSSDLFDYVTDEVDRRASVDSVYYRLRIDVPVGQRLGTFVNLSRQDQTVEDTFGGDGDLSDLSSKTDRLEGGLSWRVGSKTSVHGGVGRSETDFAETARNRGNEGEYWLAGVDWRRARTSAGATYRQNDQTGKQGSEFRTFSRGTWQARLNWTPRQRLSFGLFGSKALSYSVEEDQTYYVEERLGLRFGFPVTRQINANVFVSEGRRTYDVGDRQDDTLYWGGGLAIPLGRRVRLSIAGGATESQSDVIDRSSYQYSFRLTFGSDRRGLL